jgi:CHAD domain-containing protein
METRENTLSESERHVLEALLDDSDEIARRRARALLWWAKGQSAKAIARELGLRPGQVHKLTRSFLQKRLELFPAPALERAMRGVSGNTSVEQLIEQRPEDMPHGAHVAALALQLFDATASLHHLSPDWRRVLEAAAQLHCLGGHSVHNGHSEERARQLIVAHNFEEFTPQQRDVMACLVSAQRKQAKIAQDPLFSEFDDATRQTTLALIALLRVADTLDSTKTQSTQIASIAVNSVVEVSVVGRGAARDANRANKKTDVWNQVLTPPLVIRATEDDADGAWRAHPELDAPMSMGRLARLVLSEQFAKFKSYTEAVCQGDDADAVHDMRVATRRMNSAFRLFKPYLPAKRIKKLRRELDEWRSALGEARNLDVLLTNLKAYRAGAPAAEADKLEQVRDDWQNERKKLQAHLADLIEGSAYTKWLDRMQALVAEEDRSGTPRVAQVAPALLWEEYGKVRAYETHFESSNVQELHALRIAIKRLRYALEFFSPTLESKPVELIEPLVALQDRLGAIHDAVVAGEALTRFIQDETRQPVDSGDLTGSFQAVAAYDAHLQQEIAELRTHLGEAWQLVMRPDYRSKLAETTASF